jgi:hypothetical protein
MHPVAFRKAMIEAYMAGAEAMASGDIDQPSKKEARDWFDNQYGLIVIEEECDCCEEKDEEDGGY